MNEAPLVSVLMITYGHEKYIEEAINGVLKQNCAFEVELIIADDCSPDDTEKIVNRISKTHPKANWIKYTKHNKNLGMMPNFIWTLKQCKGKFIAFCEGDDYWVDPLKLQKQVDFLEENKDVSMVYTNVSIYYQDSGQLESISIDQKNKIFPFTDYIRNVSRIPTCTMVLRNYNVLPQYFSHFLEFEKADYILRFLLGDKGDFGFLKENTSVYRRHEKGISSQWDIINITKKGMLLNKRINEYFNHKYNFILGRHDQRAYELLFLGYMRNRNLFKGGYYFFGAIKSYENRIVPFKKIWQLIKSGIRVFLSKKTKS